VSVKRTYTLQTVV